MYQLPTRVRVPPLLLAIVAIPLFAAIDDFETGDFSAQPWQHDAVNPWQVLSLDDSQVAASATIPDLTDSSLVLERTTGAGEISFRVKVSSEVDYDYLVFYIDNLEVDAWSGEQAWETVSYPIDTGQHRFEWRYEKDDFVLEGLDRAWIDDVEIPTRGAWVTLDDFDGPALSPIWTDLTVSADPLSFADSAIHMAVNPGAAAIVPLSGFSGPLAGDSLRIDLASLAVDTRLGSAGIDIDVALDDGHTLRIQARDDASLPLPATNGARIVGGNEATPGDYPWMTALIRSSASDAASGQFCGGTLIHPFWVLSAAHCVEFTNPGEIDVVIGAHSLSGDEGERIAVSEIIVHPAFDSNSLDSDLALLRLERPSSGTPLPLAHPAIASTFAPGINATVIGWGALSEGGSGPDDLYEVEIPIVSNATANATVGGVTDNMIAAGLAAGGKDSCQGDSGGPFMVPNPAGGFLLAGIVSWGNGCARPAQYGIYTRVANFADWVVGHLEGLSLTASLIAPDGTVAASSSTPVLLNGESPSSLTIRLDESLSVSYGSSELAEFASGATGLSGLAFRVSSTGGEAALAVDSVAQFDPNVPIPATLRLLAPDTIRVGESVDVEVDILDASPLTSADLRIAFDHSRFQVTGVSAGELLPITAPDLNAANASGLLQVLAGANPVREAGVLLTITLAEIAGSPGTSDLSINSGTTLAGNSYTRIDTRIRIRGFVANDDFDGAEAITGASDSISATSSEAGSEPNEPEHAGSGGASLWYAFTAPEDGQVIFDTIGSDFDTVLAAYDGAALDALELLAEDDDSFARQSQIRVFVSAGDRLYIAVDGWNAATGGVVLNWDYSFTGAAPSLTGLETFDAGFVFPWIQGNTPWIIDANSARSGDVDDNESSSMSLIADFSAGVISFSVKVDCEPEYDFLSFEIDGEEVDYWDGQQDWQTVSHTIDAGVHELRWVYSKDFSISEGADSAWIGELSLPAGPTAVTQSIDLVAGWNWISFNTLPADSSVNSVLAALGASNGDEFKTAPHLGGTATYFEGDWLGNTQGVLPGVRYLLRVANSATVTVTGTAVDRAAPIDIVAGWNWIGFTGDQPVAVNDALANYAASDGDELKTAPSQGGTATFFQGAWFPAEFTLQPGVGYLLRSDAAGSLVFGAGP